MEMFQNIPQNRLVLYLIALGLLPILFSIFYFFSLQSELDLLQNSLFSVQEKALSIQRKQAVNTAARNHFRDVDHFYIDRNLENLTFRQEEIAGLKKLTGNANFPDDDQTKKRLDFLTGRANKLLFAEGVVQTAPTFQEVIESQVHPVEVDENDIEEVLARVEGVNIGPYKPGPNRPQLIITEFKLDRKSGSGANEVYLLNMKILRREFP